MPKVSLYFNSKATEFMNRKKKNNKVRIDATWSEAKGLRIRPTTRKIGPHMLPAFNVKARGSTVEIDEAMFDKMVEDGMPDDFFQTGERLAVVEAIYDWVVLLPGDDHEKTVGGAVVTVK